MRFDMHAIDCSDVSIRDFLQSKGVRAPVEVGPDLGIVGDHIRFRFSCAAAGATTDIQGTGASPIAQTDPNVNVYCTPASDTKWWLIIQGYRFSVSHKDANTADMVSTLLGGTYLRHTPQGRAAYDYPMMPWGAVDVGGYGLQAQAAPADLTRTWARAETPAFRMLPEPFLVDMEADTLTITTPAVASLTTCFGVIDIKGWAVPKKVARTSDMIFSPDGPAMQVRRAIDRIYGISPLVRAQLNRRQLLPTTGK